MDTIKKQGSASEEIVELMPEELAQVGGGSDPHSGMATPDEGKISVGN
jgi:hypothetical protein